MSRKLDAALAEALGNKVEWIEVIIEGYEWETGEITKYKEAVINEEGCLHYLKGDGEKLNVIPNLVPHYSSDGNAMIELIEELQYLDWEVSIRFEEGKYRAIFWKHKLQKYAENLFFTMPKAVALAAYKALTGREWEEGGGE